MTTRICRSSSSIFRANRPLSVSQQSIDLWIGRRHKLFAQTIWINRLCFSVAPMANHFDYRGRRIYANADRPLDISKRMARDE